MNERFQNKEAQAREEALLALDIESLKNTVTQELQLAETNVEERSAQEVQEFVRLRIEAIRLLVIEHINDTLQDVPKLSEADVRRQFIEIFKLAAATDHIGEGQRIRYIDGGDDLNSPIEAAAEEMTGIYMNKLDRQTLE